MRPGRLVCAAAAMAILTAPGAGAQLPDDLPDLPGAEAQATQAADVEVIDNDFDPQEFTVAEGGTVTWEQTGNNPHSVTADDGSFDSHPECPGTPFNPLNCMQNGDTYEETFDESGTFPYYCRVHGGPGGEGMSGVIVVEAATTQDTTATGGSDTPAAPADTQPATSAQTGSDDPLPITGGPGASGAFGSAMLVVAAVAWLTSRRGPAAGEGDARS